MRHGILDDDRPHALRVAHRQPHPDGATIILLEEDVTVQPKRLDESLYHLGQMLEGVSETVRRRRVAMAKARIVGRNEMIAVGEQRQQRIVHAR